MSRIIIKNLPKTMKEERLRKVFSEKGLITDCSMKYTKRGVFRNFAFIGYKTCAEADEAVKYFNKTFIDTSRIEVDYAKDLGDMSKPRAWSKYAKDSSAYKKNSDSNMMGTKPKDKETKTKKVDELIGDLKDDPEFQEFVELHKNRAAKAVWTNDAAISSKTPDKVKSEKNPLDNEAVKKAIDGSDSDTSASDEEMGNDDTDNVSKNKTISDLDYLKSKIVKSKLIDSDDSDDDEKEKDMDTSSDTSDSDDDSKHRPKESKSKEKDPKSKENSKSKDKSAKNKKATESEEPEGIAESGRLYVRNLAYVCEEEDLEELFGKYGPLSEIHLPLDRFTKKIKGFAFVTFMMPEHAVAAFSELDGTTFQGRLLHILPAQPKKEEEIEITDDMSYKKKKELQQKKQASNSKNWNTLFLGANAVADVMAEKYSTSKDQILSTEGKHSLGVRMALGETQVVSETRDFLIENGVALEAFSKEKAVRSKTVILVKNLPANTKATELQQMFARFGTLGRVLLPPSGVTAIIEFVHPSEARAGFRSLAYTKFQHIPLYLEWAPEGVFNKSPESDSIDKAGQSTNTSTSSSSVSYAESKDTSSPAELEKKNDEPSTDTLKKSEPQVEPGSCIFVKNINFDTKEDALAAHFEKYGKVHKATIAKKRDMKNPGKTLSMGYGFVEFYKKKTTDKTLKHMQHSMLDEHQLELKLSNKDSVSKTSKGDDKQTTSSKEQKNQTKILVRNIPFEAKQHEVKELFSVFGELKFVRLPKKVSGTGSHRGFGFVDFLTKEDAKRAFNALCHSTHLYGRRLVLEWADEEESIDQLRQKTADNYHNEPAKKKFKKANLMDDLRRTEKNIL